MKNTMKICLALLMSLTMSGCSFMSPVKVGPDTGYVINTVPRYHGKSMHRNMTLLVMHPDSSPAYNTTRIAFTMHPYQLSYYSQSRWIETPADMLLPLLTQTMQNTGHFKSIITPPFTGQYRYALRTQIKTLQIDYARRLPALLLTIEAHIVNANSGNVTASREFKAEVPLQQCSPYGAAVAANRATGTILGEIAAWCVSHTR